MTSTPQNNPPAQDGAGSTQKIRYGGTLSTFIAEHGQSTVFDLAPEGNDMANASEDREGEVSTVPNWSGDEHVGARGGLTAEHVANAVQHGVDNTRAKSVAQELAGLDARFFPEGKTKALTSDELQRWVSDLGLIYGTSKISKTAMPELVPYYGAMVAAGGPDEMVASHPEWSESANRAWRHIGTLVGYEPIRARALADIASPMPGTHKANAFDRDLARARLRGMPEHEALHYEAAIRLVRKIWEEEYLHSLLMGISPQNRLIADLDTYQRRFEEVVNREPSGHYRLRHGPATVKPQAEVVDALSNLYFSVIVAAGSPTSTDFITRVHIALDKVMRLGLRRLTTLSELGDEEIPKAAIYGDLDTSNRWQRSIPLDPTETTQNLPPDDAYEKTEHALHREAEAEALRRILAVFDEPTAMSSVWEAVHPEVFRPKGALRDARPSFESAARIWVSNRSQLRRWMVSADDVDRNAARRLGDVLRQGAMVLADSDLWGMGGDKSARDRRKKNRSRHAATVAMLVDAVLALAAVSDSDLVRMARDRHQDAAVATVVDLLPHRVQDLLNEPGPRTAKLLEGMTSYVVRFTDLAPPSLPRSTSAQDVVSYEQLFGSWADIDIALSTYAASNASEHDEQLGAVLAVRGVSDLRSAVLKLATAYAALLTRFATSCAAETAAFQAKLVTGMAADRKAGRESDLLDSNGRYAVKMLKTFLQTVQALECAVFAFDALPEIDNQREGLLAACHSVLETHTAASGERAEQRGAPINKVLTTLRRWTTHLETTQSSERACRVKAARNVKDQQLTEIEQRTTQ